MITSSNRSYFAVHSFNALYGDWLTHIKRKPNCVVLGSYTHDDWEDGITPPYIPSVVKPSSRINERTHSEGYPKKYCNCLIPKIIHQRLSAIAILKINGLLGHPVEVILVQPLTSDSIQVTSDVNLSLGPFPQFKLRVLAYKQVPYEQYERDCKSFSNH